MRRLTEWEDHGGRSRGGAVRAVQRWAAAWEGVTLTYHQKEVWK